MCYPFPLSHHGKVDLSTSTAIPSSSCKQHSLSNLPRLMWFMAWLFYRMTLQKLAESCHRQAAFFSLSLKVHTLKMLPRTLRFFLSHTSGQRQIRSHSWEKKMPPPDGSTQTYGWLVAIKQTKHVDRLERGPASNKQQYKWADNLLLSLAVGPLNQAHVPL